MLGKQKTLHFKTLETIYNKLSTHSYKGMKIILIRLKVHTRKKWKKTYEYKTSLSTYGPILLDFNDKFPYVAKDME
jgi:hypothetical protein